MKLLAIEVGQFGDYYNSRYQQIENYGVDLYVFSGVADFDHWKEGKFFVANTMDTTDLTKRAIEINQEQKFDGVFTLAENSVIATAIIATALGLPSITVNAAANSRNKIFMRNAHRTHNAPHPAFALTNTIDEARKAADSIGFPVILKPTLGSGSQFVYKINNHEELNDAFPTAFKGINAMSQFLKEGITSLLGPNSLLVESYLDGREFLIEAFTWDGETVLGSIVDRVTLEGNSFDDDVHHAPTDLCPLDIERVRAAVHAGAVAQGLTRSAMHAEIRFHQNKPYIIEIAARLGGGGLDFMSRLSSGYCPVKSAIDIAMGVKPNHGFYSPTGLDTFALCLISGPGTITDILVPATITNDPAVFMLKITAQPGTLIKRPPFGNDIVGFLGVSGSVRKETEFKALSYSNKIKISIK
ncbi:ATP-grasp domain-containing protein [Pseudomonas huanghezhanensis]|uniref:ATP-grasp domain-containing protein n=1 Tax=Pseudomonas huanghezhanensis TaxID=3002903 RepID=UPI002285C90C|nr:ATP-grasp domain-containing protein [Pseudomonas sp. BSw22131]